MVLDRETFAVWRLELARAWRDAPWVAGPGLLRWTTGLLYVVAGLVVLVASPFLDLSRVATVTATAVAVCAVVVGGVVIATGLHYPPWVHHVLIVVGTALVTLLALPASRDSTTIALTRPYLFVVMGAAALFSLRAALAHVVLADLCSAVVNSRTDAPAGTVVLLLGTSTATAVLVAWLARIGNAVEEDQVTRLINRRGFDRRLHEAVAASGAGNPQLSVAVLDIDGFHGINDRLGVDAAEALLAELGRRWLAWVPDGIRVGRYGGDEFAVLMPETPLGRAADLVDDLRRLAPGGLTLSAGVATWEHGDSGSVLMGRADAALLDAKTAGGGRTVVFGDPGRSASRLEAAISHDELRLVFQPIVQLSTHEVVGFEALVRWNDPEKGEIEPLEFVPQAEETGAVHSLGAWLVKQVCQTVMTAPEPRRYVSVNASVAELRNPDYAPMVVGLLDLWSVPGELLLVEVLERGFDDDDPQVVRSLQTLRSRGVRIAMDDFGAGYSSLQRIERLPLDVIKVDGSLVQAIDDDRDDAPILEAVATMGRSLGVRLVAEHVDTPHQVEVLRRLGYDYVQGYLFSRPLDWARACALTVLPASAT